MTAIMLELTITYHIKLKIDFILLSVILPVAQFKFKESFIVYGMHIWNEGEFMQVSAQIGYTRSKKEKEFLLRVH